MKSFSIVACAAVTLANANMEDLRAELEALKGQFHEQQELIKAQDARLFEAEEARRLQTELENQTSSLAALQSMSYGYSGAMDSLWLCLCGALVMFMHAGFAMLETGCCRAKNASNVLMKNLVNVCVGTIGWWVLGWGLAYGSKQGTELFSGSGFLGEGFYTRDASGAHLALRCFSSAYVFKWSRMQETSAP